MQNISVKLTSMPTVLLHKVKTSITCLKNKNVSS